MARALQRGAEAAGYQVIDTRSLASREDAATSVFENIARADCVVADATGSTPSVMYEIGMARTMAKPILLLLDENESETLPNDFGDYTIVTYRPSKSGLVTLADRVKKALAQLRQSPVRGRANVGTRFVAPFFVDWDRLERRERENLCRELLMQLGYRQVDWVKIMPEIDLVAELPKKDPDGFEYRELWLVSMGMNSSIHFIDMISHDPEYMLYRLFRESSERPAFDRESSSLTLLLIVLDQEISQEDIENLQRRRRGGRRPGGEGGIRIRVWTRDFMSQLVQQFPQLGYKYFSEEVRGAKHRKSLDELYQENVALSERQATLISAVEEERNRRIRAERDLAWKDISFAAAHKIGNPIFAIETNLDPLRRRIRESRTSEALDVIEEISISIEKAKDIVDQFKSLTRIQEMQPRPTPIRPILEHSCDSARKIGVECTLTCPSDLEAFVDPNRISECIDELVQNALHWLEGRTMKQVTIEASAADAGTLPPTLDSSRRYLLLSFRDNGDGVLVANKSRIFDAFFTTRDQGTGLGLALVRRIIEGHGGSISEIGVPQEGAHFVFYLPRAESADASSQTSPDRSSDKRKATA